MKVDLNYVKKMLIMKEQVNRTCMRTLRTSVGVVMAAEQAPAKTPKNTFTERDSSRVSEDEEKDEEDEGVETEAEGEEEEGERRRRRTRCPKAVCGHRYPCPNFVKFLFLL